MYLCIYIYNTVYIFIYTDTYIYTYIYIYTCIYLLRQRLIFAKYQTLAMTDFWENGHVFVGKPTDGVAVYATSWTSSE